MKVQELIEELQKIPNKEKEIVILSEEDYTFKPIYEVREADNGHAVVLM